MERGGERLCVREHNNPPSSNAGWGVVLVHAQLCVVFRELTAACAVFGERVTFGPWFQ